MLSQHIEKNTTEKSTREKILTFTAQFFSLPRLLTTPRFARDN